MPGLSGYDVCRELKSDPETRDIPIMFLTGLSEDADENKGLRLGAVDYVTKPVNPAILLARVKVHLENKAARDFLRDQNALLESEVKRRTLEIVDAQQATILVLAAILGTRDRETGNHGRRTQHYVELLARRLQNHPEFAEYLTDAQIDILFKSAPLHDIGKVGIPDRILLKPDRFDAEEFEIMKTHTTLGHMAIEDAESPPRREDAVSRLRQGNRLEPSGKMGRKRLPARVGGQGDSHLGAPDGGRRRLRRSAQSPRLQGRHDARSGAGEHH